MSRTRNIALVSIFMFLSCMHSGDAIAQPQISVQGGSPLLIVATGSASGGILPAQNNQARLRYRMGNVIRKVTVSTVCPGQKFTLTVEALNPSEGNASPPVALVNGMAEADFITDIPRGGNRQQSARLRYVAAPTYSQGNSFELGDDVHVVTYTIVQQ